MKPDQISRTAAFIAIKFYGLTKDQPYRSLFDDKTIAFYDRLVAALPSPLHHYHSLLDKRWLRPLFRWSEELLLPGDLMHILMRKYCISAMVEELKGRFSQLLVLGAGFDHLAAQCSAEGITCLEIDTPRMAKLKRTLLSEQEAMNEHISICEGNIKTQSLIELLRDSALDPQTNTIVVAEGFFDYLTKGDALEILGDLSAFFESEVNLISTAFALNELNAFHRLVFKTGVRMVGETLLLNHSLADFQDLLEESGFKVSKCIPGSRMQEHVLHANGITMPILTGFYLLQGSLEKEEKKY